MKTEQIGSEQVSQCGRCGRAKMFHQPIYLALAIVGDALVFDEWAIAQGPSFHIECREFHTESNGRRVV